MTDLSDNRVLVIGLDPSGQAACRLLRRLNAHVHAVDHRGRSADELDALRELGVTVEAGAARLPQETFALAVVSAGTARGSVLLEEARRLGTLSVVSDLELAFRHSLCLHIAVAGTNGKATVSALLQHVLERCHRTTAVAGTLELPVCDAVERTKELDFLIVKATALQLEFTRFYRPAVAVLLNTPPMSRKTYPSDGEYVRAEARLFANQQAFDWAIVQSEALAEIRSMQIPVAAKVITLSASHGRADLFVDRGLLISRLEGWTGPLIDMDKTRVKGPHHAENYMAALAVGRVLRLPLEDTAEAVKSFGPQAHCCEVIARERGVTFVDDARAENLDALHKGLLAMPPGKGGEPNVLLIAGGEDEGLDYHDIGPVLARRVKAAFVFGNVREKLRAAWGLFTPCTLVDSLLEAVSKSAEKASSGDVVLFSPACSSADLFHDAAHRGGVYQEAAAAWCQSGRSIAPAAGNGRRRKRAQPKEKKENF